MKIVDIKCPHCGGELHIASDRSECFCEYCGAKLLLDEGVVHTVTVIRDEAKLRELQIEEERLREAKEKLAEYEALQAELKSKQRPIRITIISATIGSFVLAFAVMLIFAGNEQMRSIVAGLFYFHLVMLLVCLIYTLVRKDYSSKIYQQKKLVEKLEYHRILGDKSSK